MNARQAKKMACSMASKILGRETPERCCIGEDGEPLSDTETARREKAWQELVDEMWVRGQSS